MVQVHLISAPWGSPIHPSIQTGALKSYLRSNCASTASTHCHNPCFRIPYYVAGANYSNLVRRLVGFEEYPYLLLYARRFLDEKLTRRYLAPFANREISLGPRLLNRLDSATQRYAREEIVPKLRNGEVNLLAFTCVFNQVYASIYLARLCRAFAGPDIPIVNVFGGPTVSMPQCSRILRRLVVDGLIVAGEGEEKLAAIVSAVDRSGPGVRADDLHQIVPGVYSVSRMQPNWDRDEGALRSHLGDLESLPTPDYSDFYEELRNASADDAAFYALCDRVLLPMEGSRGCFGRCDFCGLHYHWNGFRHMPGARVLQRTSELSVRHQTNKYQFVDNVCNTWARGFAAEARQKGLRYDAFFELRADHSEEFWTELALSGEISVQIGVEALSPPLLNAMRKGTHVYQNVATWKYLRELGIWRAGANLITHHPLSTVGDVVFTRQLLERISHLPIFFLSEYTLQYGSPLYEALPPKGRACLRARVPRFGDLPGRYSAVRNREQANVPLPKRMRWLFFSPFYISPRCYQVSTKVQKAWDDFGRWYRRASLYLAANPPRLDRIFLGPGVAKVIDTRKGPQIEHVLQGAGLAVLEAGHAAPLVASLKERVPAASDGEISRALRDLGSKGLITILDDHVVSLPLRPREELLSRLQKPSEARTEKLAIG